MNEAEQAEFSLYCIVQGDAFTMPLAADEYILDVTTELQKAAQPFYLIFCRSVWYHPLRHDASPLYTEVNFYNNVINKVKKKKTFIMNKTILYFFRSCSIKWLQII